MKEANAIPVRPGPVHLQTERRFDLANGAYVPLSVTLCQDGIGPNVVILNGVDSVGGKVFLHVDAVLQLAALIEKFRTVR